MLTEMRNCQNVLFRVIRLLKTDSKEVEGGSDGCCLSEEERDEVCK